MENVRRTPVNYAGNKAKLIEKLKKYIPKEIDIFYDLFAGGCTVSINVDARRVRAYDINKHLIDLYKYLKIQNLNTFTSDVSTLINKYGFSKSWINGVSYYTKNNKKIAKDGKVSCGLDEYNTQAYLKLRTDFNTKTAKQEFDNEYQTMFYLLIVHSYCYQIRFNSKGGFNMPPGRGDWNESMQSKLTEFINYIQSIDITFTNASYQTVKIQDIKPADFVYCDPPYLITTAAYNESNGWTEKNEKELLSYLEEVHKNGIRFMLSNVTEHKGKKNTLLIDWVEKNGFRCIDMNHSYNSFGATSKKSGTTKEVIVINY